MRPKTTSGQAPRHPQRPPPSTSLPSLPKWGADTHFWRWLSQGESEVAQALHNTPQGHATMSAAFSARHGSQRWDLCPLKNPGDFHLDIPP